MEKGPGTMLWNKICAGSHRHQMVWLGSILRPIEHAWCMARSRGVGWIADAVSTCGPPRLGFEPYGMLRGVLIC